VKGESEKKARGGDRDKEANDSATNGEENAFE